MATLRSRVRGLAIAALLTPLLMASSRSSLIRGRAFSEDPALPSASG